MQLLQPLLGSHFAAAELCRAQLRRLVLVLLKGSEVHEALEALSVFLEAPALPKEADRH